jgi:hypothetical protein
MGFASPLFLFILVTQVYDRHKFVRFQGFLGQRTIAYTYMFLGLKITKVITNLHNWKLKNLEPTMFFDSKFFQKTKTSGYLILKYFEKLELLVL